MARPSPFASLLLTALAVGATALLAGCSSHSGSGGLAISAIDLSAPEVGAGHVLLAVNVTLADAGKAAAGDLLRAKAYDVSTGFLATTQEVPLAKGLPAAKPVTLLVELPRQGTYRLDVQLLHGGKAVGAGSVDLRDLSRLQPTLHATGLRIDLDFQLAAANATRTDVVASAYLTNEARAASHPLSLQLKARDLRTGLVAAQVWAPVGAIGPDETRQANATMNVALGRDYDVEAVLWDGSVIVERGVGRVALSSLAPPLPAGGASSDPRGTVASSPAGDLVFGQPSIAPPASQGGKSSAPGLGLVAVVGVLAGAGLLLRRRQA